MLDNLDKLHTTEMGIERMKRNLHFPSRDVEEHCKKIISSSDCQISRRGKNWYCENEEVIVTVNAHSFTIITAHLKKKKDG